MGAPQPQFLPEAFAIAAAGPNRNTIPAAPVTTQRASFDLGFPPLTMTPVVAGGKPMLGPDMNGILYMMSSHNVYTQSGQPYRWSAAVAAAIGGYASGTLLGSTDGVTLWMNILDGNATDPDAGGANWIPLFSYGITLLPPSVGGALILTPAQVAKSVIVVSGALVANLQVVLPNSQRRWLIVNNTSGAFTVTAKTAAGTGVPIPQGSYAAPTEVYGDGTNIYNVVAPVALPIDVAPTPNTIAQRSNTGYLYATYFNQNSGLENFAISEVFAGVGDGFLRKINKPNFAANFDVGTFAGQVTDAQVPQTAVTQHKIALLTNPTLTGTALAPTPAAGDNSTKIATTAFVRGAVTLAGNGSWTTPGGLIIKWGTTAVNGATAFPGGAFPNNCYGVVLTNINTTDQIYVTATSVANFSIHNPGLRTVFWIALGN